MGDRGSTQTTIIDTPTKPRPRDGKLATPTISCMELEEKVRKKAEKLCSKEACDIQWCLQSKWG